MAKPFFYPKDLSQTLEFEWVRQRIIDSCYGTLGQSRIEHWKPFQNLDSLHLQQRAILSFMALRELGKSLPGGFYDRLDHLWESLPKKGFVLELHQLADLRKFLVTVEDNALFVEKLDAEYEAIKNFASELDYDREPLNRINKIMNEDNELRPDASPELVRLRRQKSDKQKELDGVFRKLLRQMKKSGLLSETEESIRGGRRVLSVPSENKRQIPGIIHDESDSGKSTYIEPMETVNLHNDLAELDIEERKEIRRILTELSDYLRPQAESFHAYQDFLARLDALQAKARFCGEIECQPVEIATDAPIRLIRAFHPHLWWHNREKGQETIPLNLSLSEESRILVISGPNAGGKSVALKTLGLLQIMALHGLPIPASENSALPFRTKLLADIGDAQSIEDELSTYSSRLRRMKVFLKEADAESMVFIDEFGTGTDPHLGGAMAEAILEELVESGAFGLVTTHYSNLKAMANQIEGLENGRMIFDEQNLQPTFRLEQGKPGSSYTFDVAKNSGLPSWLIKKARKKVATENVDLEDLLRKLQKDKEAHEAKEQAMEEENKRLRQMMKQMDRMQMDLENQRKRLSYEFKQFKAEELARKESMLREFEKEIKTKKHQKQDLSEIRASIQAQKAKVSADTKALKKDLFIKGSDQPIEEGMKVRMIESEVEGVVESIKKGKARVRFGMIHSEVPVKDLIAIDNPNLEIKSQGKHKVSREAQVAKEIDLRGMYVDEALKQAEGAIDQALMSGVTKLRIVHGKGTGKLRKAIWQMLKDFHQVKSYRHPEPQDGGNGVTEIEI